MRSKLFPRRRTVDRVRPMVRVAFEPLELRQLLTTITVNTVSDASSHSGVSLRDAISVASVDARNGTSDTVTFAAALAGQTISLTQGALAIGTGGAGSGTISITAASPIIVDGGSTSGIVSVLGGVHAAISGLTLQHGTAPNGGAINNLGLLGLTNCTLSANTASNSGGGVYNAGTMTLTGCVLDSNVATVSGGGVYNATGGDATFISSTFISNHASDTTGTIAASDGGAVKTFGTVHVSGSTFSNNSASGYGGAISNRSTLIINHSTFTGNVSYLGGGGIDVQAAMSLQNSYFAYNYVSGPNNGGGAIYGGHSASATVSNCTFFKNSAVVGGALGSLSTTFIISNCTISQNFASSSAGGVGQVTDQRGISDGRFTLINDLIANNTAPSASPDVSQGSAGIQAASAYNLIGDGSTQTVLVNGNNGNQVGTAANPIPAGLLLPDYNGGPTQTMALTPTARARRAGGRITSLAAAATASDSTLTVALYDAFAATSGSFIVQIENEQILINSETGTTLSVSRGYNGTTAAAHALGAKIYWANDQTDARRVGANDIGAYQFEIVSSKVNALPATQAGTSFAVSWTGQPGTEGYGVANYTIYVSDNDAQYTIWKHMTTATSATFTGIEGHTYRFYSIATDTDGNVQPTPTSPQAVTTVPVAGSVTVTAGGTGYSEPSGYWSASTMTGYNNTATRYSNSSGATAKWAPTLAAGTYTVQIYNPVASNNTSSAKVTVMHNGVATTSTIDQSTGSSGFITLGTFTFTGGGNEYVTLQNLSTGYLRSNVVQFIRVS